MLLEKMQTVLNKQLNEELFSSYLYLSMAAYCNSIGLQGFANWMQVQVQEENFHAMKMYNYILDRGGKIILDKIEKPKTEWNSITEVFEETLKHEQFITSCINKLVDVSIEERDHATNSFLQWFVTEQIEEELTAGDILSKLKLIGENGNAIFMLDKEMAARVFVPPVA
ncbi:MAG: ferritin [Candidatus Gastranaerophilales bacterium]|nr:ferritin [Candidatus Gastranaerophilales bacterium]